MEISEPHGVNASPPTEKEIRSFNSLEEARTHVCEEEKARGFEMSGRTSSNSETNNTRRQHQLLLCSRGGKYRQCRPKSTTNPRKTKTKKMGCPYKVNIKDINGKWIIEPSKNEHTCKTLTQDTLKQEWSDEQLEKFNQLNDIGVPSHKIAHAMSTNGSTVRIRDIKNKKARIKKSLNESGGENQLQSLLQVMTDKEYIFVKRLGDDGELIQLFFAKIAAIQMVSHVV